MISKVLLSLFKALSSVSICSALSFKGLKNSWYKVIDFKRLKVGDKELNVAVIENIKELEIEAIQKPDR